MAHLAVTVVLFFVACAHAAPAPKPDNPRFTLVEDSALGLGVAGEHSKANGVVDSSVLATPVEAPIDTGNNVPDVTVVKNVNAGAAFATSGSIATGIQKITKLNDNPATTAAKTDKINSPVPFVGWI